MTGITEMIKQSIANCSCGKHNKIEIEPIVVESGAMLKVAPYLLKHHYKQITLVADAHTFQAAGKDLIEQLMSVEIQCTLCIVKPNKQGDVVADEVSIIQAMLDVSAENSDCILAVGSGTIHDIVRFVGYKMNKPFVSIPTAPSVDGFTSKGAPIIIRGEKKTISASAPTAIFADLNVLIKAPQSLVIAGFGDMLGKYTSLFDWRFSHLTANEPYCSATANITKQALIACVENVQEISQRNENGIRILMNALIDSGLAMLLFGQSHPASGAEHHLSHYWEMEYIRLGKNQLLHGMKVGIACAEISKLYHTIVEEEQLLKAIAANPNKDKKLAAIQANGLEIKALLNTVPDSQQLHDLFCMVGGPDNAEELGIDQELLSRSLKEAHKVRDRYTMLKAWNTAL
ncbi:MAG: glycerol-phosphate dehydrogenase [Bacilli bacterium]|nr:glycerol-phosphate dehydrogenase [Bacilli bacterium]